MRGGNGRLGSQAFALCWQAALSGGSLPCPGHVQDLLRGAARAVQGSRPLAHLLQKWRVHRNKVGGGTRIHRVPQPEPSQGAWGGGEEVLGKDPGVSVVALE